MIDEAALPVPSFPSLRRWRETALWALAFLGAAALMSVLMCAQSDFQRFRIETAIAKMGAEVAPSLLEREAWRGQAAAR